jgi:hypothetical protein
MIRSASVLILVSLLVQIFPASPVGAQSSPGPSAIITEIKLGGGSDVTFADNSTAKDFVSIFNLTNSSLDVTGWRLEYAKTTFDAQNCANTSWAVSTTTTLSGSLSAGTVSLPIKRSLNDNEAGSLRLISSSGFVQDLVGWGSNPSCFEGAAATLPANGKSLQRYLECDEDLPIDSANNSLDFIVNSQPSPGALAENRKASCNEEEPPDEDPVEPVPVASDCEGLTISEILPNPAGSDSGSEFIELHNSTNSPINLRNCKLQTSANSQHYTFSDLSIPSGHYKAFYDSTTGLTLANSAGGTVWLLDHADVELSDSNYPADLRDDQSWAFISGSWQKTFQPTPNQANVLMSSLPCPDGQVRNPETNRCRSSQVVSALLKPCDPGKVRNPETNRCRSISSALSALKACDDDEFRNPETNRCKKYASINSLKPCGDGKERNPETNRCRNIAAISSSGFTDVKDIPSPIIPNNLSWWFAGASMIGAVGYALFEWRRELLSGISGFKDKFAVAGQR